MPYRIAVTKLALKHLEKLGKPDKERIVRRLKDLESDPYSKSKNIVNSEPVRRTSRVGTWRVVFRVIEAEKVIVIADIDTRGEVYKDY